MFSTFHIIMFVISILSIPLAIFLAKSKVSLMKVIYVCMGLALFSEIIRAIYFTYVHEESGNVYLLPEWLPLQLCSIQIIFIWVMGLTKNEETRNKLIRFFIPTALVGAFIALVIPATYLYLQDMVYVPENYGSWHRLSINFFLYHAMLVFLALFFYIRMYKELKFKESFLQCFTIISLLFLASIILNSMLQYYDPNFFFTAGPPVEGLPILNLENGWEVYILTLVTLGALSIFLTYLPLYLRDKREKK